MDLHGKKYIGLLRCSSPSPKDTRIDDQRRLLESFATEHGLVCADLVALEGVSGSQPCNRSDINQLIARKHERDDFDILLIQDTSRFTRGGAQHFHEIESKLHTRGDAVALEIVRMIYRWHFMDGRGTCRIGQSRSVSPRANSTIGNDH